MSAIEEQKAVYSDEIDLYAYVELLWRHRWSLFGLVVVAVAIAAAVSLWVIPPTYEAVSLVQVGQGEPSLGSPAAYQSVWLSSQVLARVSKAVGVQEQVLEGAVRVDLIPNSSLVKLAVRIDSPTKAKAIGDTWHRTFLTQLQDLWVKRLDVQLAMQRARVEGIRRSFDSLLQPPAGVPQRVKSERQILVSGDLVANTGELDRLEQLKAQVERGELSDVTILMPFRAEPKPVGPRTALNVSVAGLLAVMAGVFGVFAVEAWRSRRGVTG